MCDRIVDVIVWAVSQLRADNVDAVQVDYLLKEKGFSEKEISTAFSWMSEKLQSKSPNELMMMQVFPSKSFRIFSEFERRFFTNEAYSLVIELLSIGLISNQHIEMLIEHAENYGVRQIENNMVKQFVAFYLFDVPSPDHIGNRLTLSGNESIN